MSWNTLSSVQIGDMIFLIIESVLGLNIMLLIINLPIDAILLSFFRKSSIRAFILNEYSSYNSIYLIVSSFGVYSLIEFIHSYNNVSQLSSLK